MIIFEDEVEVCGILEAEEARVLWWALMLGIDLWKEGGRERSIFYSFCLFVVFKKF